MKVTKEIQNRFKNITPLINKFLYNYTNPHTQIYLYSIYYNRVKPIFKQCHQI